MDNQIKLLIEKYKNYIDFCDRCIEEENSGGDDWYNSRKNCLIEIVKDLEELIDLKQ